ncbi:Mediator of RNA polymerase II transcription subunit 26 [Gryllus bimaculatus]|nr:Mediator of RNA polymerase II transcription subunit 26 [Gryllus bimaculatus]
MINLLEHHRLMKSKKDNSKSTRLGKYVNELRRKTTNEALARRAKELVRQWRHLIAHESPAPLQVSTSNHLRNGLTVPTTRLGGTLSPGLPRTTQSASVTTKISISPPLSENVVNTHIPTVSPAASIASSGKSSSPSLQTQLSSSVARHKQSVYPYTSPVTHNSQTRNHKVHRPESPGLTNTHVNQVLASESVPKTHVANKRLRKDSPPPPPLPPPPPPSTENSLKFGQPNGGVVSSSDLEVAHPNVEVIEECSRDSFGATSDHGSITFLSESRSVLKNEVPQDNGLSVHIKNKTPGRRKRIASKGAKTKTTLTDNSSHPSAVDDIVKEKIASIARIPKVKTTQELLAGLQARTVPSEELPSANSVPTGSRTSLMNCTLPHKRGSPSDALEISRNKTEHIAKFLRSQSELQEFHREQTTSELPRSFNECMPHASQSVDTVNAPPVSRISKEVQPSNNLFDNFEQSVSSKDIQSASSGAEGCADKIVTDILARLPPVKYDEIKWDEPQDSIGNVVSVEETENLVDRLYNENIDGISGNYSHEANGDTFREWHETVVRTSYQGDLLTILPYVVID